MSVIILEDNTASIVAALQSDASEVRHETAWRILTSAQQNAPKDTEALSLSVYVTDEYGSTYAAAVAAAQGKNSKVGILSEVPKERDTTIVAFAVEYALINEFYTGPMNPGAHPFLGPAVEAERPAFEAATGGRVS